MKTRNVSGKIGLAYAVDMSEAAKFQSKFPCTFKTLGVSL